MTKSVKYTLSKIRSGGMSATYKDGEYRVNFPHGSESTAYYTEDPEDAILTAYAMKSNRAHRFGLFGA